MGYFKVGLLIIEALLEKVLICVVEKGVNIIGVREIILFSLKNRPLMNCVILEEGRRLSSLPKHGLFLRSLF